MKPELSYPSSCPTKSSADSPPEFSDRLFSAPLPVKVALGPMAALAQRNPTGNDMGAAQRFGQGTVYRQALD